MQNTFNITCTDNLTASDKKRARSHIGHPAHVHVGKVLEAGGLVDEHVDLPSTESGRMSLFEPLMALSCSLAIGVGTES